MQTTVEKTIPRRPINILHGIPPLETATKKRQHSIQHERKQQRPIIKKERQSKIVPIIEKEGPRITTRKMSNPLVECLHSNEKQSENIEKLKSHLHEKEGNAKSKIEEISYSLIPIDPLERRVGGGGGGGFKKEPFQENNTSSLSLDSVVPEEYKRETHNYMEMYTSERAMKNEDEKTDIKDSDSDTENLRKRRYKRTTKRRHAEIKTLKRKKPRDQIGLGPIFNGQSENRQRIKHDSVEENALEWRNVDKKQKVEIEKEKVIVGDDFSIELENYLEENDNIQERPKIIPMDTSTNLIPIKNDFKTSENLPVVTAHPIQEKNVQDIPHPLSSLTLTPPPPPILNQHLEDRKKPLSIQRFWFAVQSANVGNSKSANYSNSLTSRGDDRDIVREFVNGLQSSERGYSDMSKILDYVQTQVPKNVIPISRIDFLKQNGHKIPMRTRRQEDAYLRTPYPNKERFCICDNECEGMKIPGAVPVILVEILSRQELQDVIDGKGHPQNRQMCVMCARFRILYDHTNVRAECKSITGGYLLQNYYNSVIEGEYRLEDCILSTGQEHQGLILPVVAHVRHRYEQTHENGIWFFKQTGYGYPDNPTQINITQSNTTPIVPLLRIPQSITNNAITSSTTTSVIKDRSLDSSLPPSSSPSPPSPSHIPEAENTKKVNESVF